jgi:hypothetical protein
MQMLASSGSAAQAWLAGLHAAMPSPASSVTKVGFRWDRQVIFTLPGKVEKGRRWTDRGDLLLYLSKKIIDLTHLLVHGKFYPVRNLSDGQYEGVGYVAKSGQQTLFRAGVTDRPFPANSSLVRRRACPTEEEHDENR